MNEKESQKEGTLSPPPNVESLSPELEFEIVVPETDSKLSEPAPLDDDPEDHEETPPLADSLEVETTKKEADLFTEQLEALISGQESLLKEFQSKLKYDAQKQQTIDNLYNELKTYKDDLGKSLLKPVIMDIIMLTDSLAKLVGDLQKKPAEELSVEKLLRYLLDTTGDLEEILYRQGIETFSSSAEKFNPSKQKVVRVIPTEDESLDKHIEDRIKKGYEWDGQKVRPEFVNVYKYTTKSTSNQPNKNKQAQNEQSIK